MLRQVPDNGRTQLQDLTHLVYEARRYNQGRSSWADMLKVVNPDCAAPSAIPNILNQILWQACGAGTQYQQIDNKGSVPLAYQAIRAGADPLGPTALGEQPIHLAARSGNLSVAAFLLRH